MRHLLLLFLPMLAFCASCVQEDDAAARQQVDSFNERAYAYRYKQIDTVRARAMAAYELARRYDYVDGMAEAMNLLMFERFQQMDFDSVMTLADELEALAPHEVELLICDVMQMKVDQRTSDNRSFFLHRSHALQRLRSLQRREDRLSSHLSRRFDFARSELHITASTYFYYVDQRERSLIEIHEAEPYIQLPGDTAQWLYYCYMRGSGGLAESVEDEDIAIEEFEYLLKCFTLARYAGYPFFEANSAQSLATRFANPDQRACLQRRYPEIYHYLTGIFSADDTAFHLAQWALTLFRDYDDLYQTACTLRTLGELAFDNHCYAEAIDFYTQALDCVNFHHDVYYASDAVLEGSSQSLLLPYDAYADTLSIERRWLQQEGVRTVPEWIAGIRQQLSVAYSALNLKPASDFNRNIYLDLLEVTREDAELKSRAAALYAESLRLRYLQIMVGIVGTAVIVLFFWLFRRWRRRGEDESRQLRRQFQQLDADNLRRTATLDEEQEQLMELQQATDLRIFKDKRLNIEKHAKLSLVRGIMPFLDRIIHEIGQMLRRGTPNERSVTYIRELLQPIEEYNRLLTEWIQVEQGQLSLQITTFDLESLFASLRKSHFAYDQKGLTLRIEPTDLSVKADRALTLFMINTLADNARKFTPSGGTVTISATAGENADGRYVEISVADTGCGLSAADIDLILNNKVYDAAQIGQQQDKGFGFGLMNCKGIIEKYRKTNPLFRVCRFDIESREDAGSRFFFRLPRVLTTFLLMFFSLIPLRTLAATPSSAYVLMDSLYYCNVQGRYVEALDYAEEVIAAINAQGLKEKMELRPQTDAVAETFWWQQGREVDYQLLMALRNEVAVAALALHDWPLYRINDRVYRRLYKLLGQDTTLENYCQLTERTQQHARMAIIALPLLLLLALLLLYFFWLRPLMLRRREMKALSAQQMESVRALHAAEQQRRLQDIELAEDEHHRRLYEETRLHVQNQIIDNCLSTIKHETMYYPGRIQNLIDRHPIDLPTLNETATYYKEIFSLLTAQADAQSAAVGFRRSRLTFQEVTKNTSARFAARLRRMLAADTNLHQPLELLCRDLTAGASFTADVDLIQVLLDELLDYEASLIAPPSSSSVLTLTGTVDARFVCFSLENPNSTLSSEELHNFFMPHHGGIPLLIARQVIREHDTFMGHPGCRIFAAPLPSGGHSITFSLPLSARPLVA